MTIRLKPHQKIHIQSSSDIFHLLQPILRRSSKLDRDREHLWVLCLDQSHTVRHLELTGLGTLRSVLIDPVEVFSLALLKRAAAIALVHNHPSGRLIPSRADRLATERLREGSRFLNIPLLDHLIISETGFYSFADQGEFTDGQLIAADTAVRRARRDTLVALPGIQITLDNGTRYAFM